MQLVPEAVQEPYLRAADRAGVGLGVEAAVGWGVVISLAVGAHLEVCHRGHGPVVGHRAGYGEPRAAVGAVGERIPVAPVCRIEEFLKTLRTGCYVWRDQGAAPDSFPAFLYPEVSLLPDREGPPGYAFDHGQRRSFFLYLLQEAFQLLRRTLRLDVDPFGVVAHQPGKPMPPRQSVDEGPKAHALHDAPHGDLPALLSGGSHSTNLCRFNCNSRSTSSTYSSSSYTSGFPAIGQPPSPQPPEPGRRTSVSSYRLHLLSAEKLNVRAEPCCPLR